MSGSGGSGGSAELGLRAALLAAPAVTALLADPTGGVYVGHAPQGAAVPYVELHRTGTDPMLTLDGTGGMRTAEIDVDCKATNRIAACELADAVEAVLADFSGTAGGVTIDAVLLTDRLATDEPPEAKRGTGRYVDTLDLSVQFTP